MLYIYMLYIKLTAEYMFLSNINGSLTKMEHALGYKVVFNKSQRLEIFREYYMITEALN